MVHEIHKMFLLPDGGHSSGNNSAGTDKRTLASDESARATTLRRRGDRTHRSDRQATTRETLWRRLATRRHLFRHGDIPVVKLRFTRRAIRTRAPSDRGCNRLRIGHVVGINSAATGLRSEAGDPRGSLFGFIGGLLARHWRVSHLAIREILFAIRAREERLIAVRIQFHAGRSSGEPVLLD